MDGEATWVGLIDLEDPDGLRPVGPQMRTDHADARVLVRVHGVPLGFVELPLRSASIDPDDVLREALHRHGEALSRHLRSDDLDLPGNVTIAGLPGREACREITDQRWHEPLSVVVCTRNRPRQLADCLAPLSRLRYHDVEVIVVDNAPQDDGSARSFEDVVGNDPRFRYVVEPRPGLSRARNRGLDEARHDHVAFTDDDVLVDPLWLDGIARGFDRDPDAGCVTGLVPSAQLDTPFQRYFERRVWWSSGTEPHVYDLRERAHESKLFPFDAGRLGTGANFAVDARVIRRLGGFDEALGAGSPTRGGEDLDAFVRILRAGRTLVYEPSALVFHVHRATLGEIRSHMYGYGMGLSAYLTKHLVDRGTRREMLERAPAGMAHMLRLWRRGRGAGASQPSLILAEARGMVAGPIALWSARRSDRSRAR